MDDIENPEISTYNLDHYGLVASICRKLRIAERIDERIVKKDPRIIVSTGKAVEAMILNGLGFVNHRLYMVSNFFSSKPVEKLLGNGIQAKNLSDDVLGKALDALAAYGQTSLFFEIVIEILTEWELLGKTKRLDSTSVSVCGDYILSDSDLDITYGYSKDGRPDMKQFMINLATTGKADIPFWFEANDGNSSDKSSFRKSAVEIIQKMKGEIKQGIAEIHVSDSAFYTIQNIEAMQNMKWLSRVPESIKEARELLENDSPVDSMKPINDMYLYSSHNSQYAQTPQRWLVIYSEASYTREKATFEKRLVKATDNLEKKIWHLENQKFDSLDVAKQEAKRLDKSSKYHIISIKDIEKIPVYEKRGRQKKDAQAISHKYKLIISYIPDKEKIRKELNKKGKFILASNELDEKTLSDLDMLTEYKELQGTERGFRFLKDPWFMASDVYLKKESRISSLMMIMMLCLLVYNFSQNYVREYLHKNKETLPNQKQKEIQNPTIRWIYQIMTMAAISVVKIRNDSSLGYKEIVTNIKPVHKKIISIFGPEALQIYGFK